MCDKPKATRNVTKLISNVKADVRENCVRNGRFSPKIRCSCVSGNGIFSRCYLRQVHDGAFRLLRCQEFHINPVLNGDMLSDHVSRNHAGSKILRQNNMVPISNPTKFPCFHLTLSMRQFTAVLQDSFNR